MKPTAESLALDKAVKALVKVTEKSWSGYTPQQQARKLKNLKKFMASLKTRKPAKSSRRSQARPGRRRALARG